MSFTDDYDKAAQDASLAILKGIEQAAEESRNLTPGARAETLKNLAEAYAWVTVPNNSH